MQQRLLVLILALAWAGQGVAQTRHCGRDHALGARCHDRCPCIGCCPDDYCRKPMPAICPLHYCGGCDDYCRKPMPCLSCLPGCGGCDDYCRKPMPCLLCPPWSPHLRCAPCQCPCAPSPCR